MQTSPSTKPFEYAVSAGEGTLLKHGHTGYNHLRRIQQASLRAGHTCIFRKVPTGELPCVTGE